MTERLRFRKFAGFGSALEGVFPALRGQLLAFQVREKVHAAEGSPDKLDQLGRQPAVVQVEFTRCDSPPEVLRPFIWLPGVVLQGFRSVLPTGLRLQLRGWEREARPHFKDESVCLLRLRSWIFVWRYSMRNLNRPLPQNGRNWSCEQLSTTAGSSTLQMQQAATRVGQWLGRSIYIKSIGS